jgi:CHAT domain-containing protein
VLKPGDQHLTDDQIDRLADLSGTSDLVAHQVEVSDEGTASHLSDCPDCRSLLDARIAAKRKLAVLKAPSFQDRGEFCPSDEEWMNVAAGLAEKEVTQKMMDHAAACDHCGPFLHELVKEFSDATSPEEAKVVASLQSSSPDWQKHLAARLSASSADQEKKVRSPLGYWSWKWFAFGCAVAALAVALVWIVLPRPERRVERLIAEAYTERRNLEPRIPGAQYGPVRIERSQQSSHLDSPPSLLEAEKGITDNLAKHPSDPFWLQARARAELLEGNYTGAIAALREALDAKPNSPSLLVDLATAYSQRADASGNSEDSGRAIELLGKALQSSPHDPVALFNRALISRKALLFSQAIQDWQNYLAVDPNSKWADEARARMEEARQEQQKRKKSSLTPLLTPSQLAAVRLDDPASVDEIDGRFESYAAAALSRWLAIAYPLASTDDSEILAARDALSKLAKLSLVRHSDSWWADLLEEKSSPLFPQAADHLSSAMRANESGDTAAAHKHAALAIRIFQSIGGNEAGTLGALVEDLFAFNIDQNAKECTRAMEALQHFPQIRTYRWLETEYHIQRGNCLWLGEDLGRARGEYATAATEATTAGYKVILLGAQDHWSMAAGAGGDYAGGWLAAMRGLKLFWDGDFDDVRGYNFYYSLSEIARFRREPFLELSIWKEAIPLTESSQDLAQVAVAHSLFANAAMATHDFSQALSEFEQASQLFARSPQTESTRLARLEAETRRAGVENSLGQTDSALSHLKEIEPELLRLSEDYLKVLFYDNFGKALVKNGELSGGEAALHSALVLAERRLQSVSDRNSRIEWKLNASDTYRDLVSLMFRKGDVEGALELWEAFKAAPVRIQGKVPPSTAEAPVAARLRSLSNETIVSYALLPDELLIWVYDDRGVNAHRALIQAAELSAASARFRELSSDPKSDINLVRKQARTLYEQLIAPVEAHLLPNRTLVIELDEALDGLPMEALLDPRFRYLGERGPLLSSLGVLYQLDHSAGPQITPQTPALVVAVSAPHLDDGPPVAPLPDVVSEGEMIAGRFRSVTLLTENQATLNETLQRLPPARIFHFAGHSSNSYAVPGLMLFDGIATTVALEKQQGPVPQLVVLSACDTEAGGTGSADDADSLVGHFVRSGVPRVVATRWNVDSAATRAFMDQFYEHLLKGSSVEEAIFSAQTFLRNQSATAHPSYWAAFATFGSSSD